MRLIGLCAVLCLAAAAQNTTTLSVSPNPVGVGQPTTITATVSPAGTSGFVAFMEGTRLLATAPIQNGQAIVRYRFPLPGIHSIRAVSAGTASAPVPVTVPSTAPVSFGLGMTAAGPLQAFDGHWRVLDINRDGIDDAVFLSAIQQAVRVALGTGDPSKPLSDYIVTSLPQFANVNLVDVNADGYIDLMLNLTGPIDFWLGDGSGRFVPSAIKISGTQTGARPVEANGDGIPDFVVQVGNPLRAAIWLSTSLGSWNLAPIYVWEDEFGGGVLDATGDFNGDGRTDFIVHSSTLRRCKVVLATAPSAYSPAGDWFDCGATVASNDYVAEDVNADGRTDLIHPSEIAGQAWGLRLATPGGTMGTVIPIPLIAGASSEELIGVADWDLDGIKDIISGARHQPPLGSSENSRSYVRIRKGKGDGQFTHLADYVADIGEGASFRFADWNSDGLADLVTFGPQIVHVQFGILNLPPRVGVIFMSGPDAVVGKPRVFSVSADDGNGDLRYMRIVFGKTPSDSGGCAFTVDVKNRTVRIDGSTQGAVPLPVKLQNAYCAIDLPASVFTGTITPFAPLAGVNKLFVRATDELGLQSGWGEGLPINVVDSPPVLPVFRTVSPSHGSSAFETLTVTLYDPNGADEIRDVLLLVSDTVNGANACLIHFDVKNVKVELFNNAGTGYLLPGPGGVTSNGQCAIRDLERYSAATPTELILSVPVAFTSGFHGTHKLFVNAVELGGASTGWLDRGAFNVRSRTPGDGPGTRSLLPEYSSNRDPILFTAEFTHSDPAQHYLGYIFVMQTPSPVAFSASKACILEYNRISHTIRMINDAGTGWSEPKAAGTNSGAVSNSQCTVNAMMVTGTVSGEVMTVRALIELKPAYTGPHATFLQAFDASGRHSGVRQFGYSSWLNDERRPGPFLPVGPATATEAGSETNVSFAFGPNGSIEWSTVLIADGIGNPGCQIYWFPKTAQLRLVNDDGTTLLAAPGPQTPGGPAVASNSRCSVDAGSLMVDFGADGQRITVRVVFNPETFSGKKQLYSLALSTSGLVTHWRPGGSFFIQ